MSLQDAIVLWLNKIDFVNIKLNQFTDLYDGITFNILLHAVDANFFPIDQTETLIKNPGNRTNQFIHKHLIDIQNRINSYRSNIQCKSGELQYVDMTQLSKFKDKEQIMHFFEIVMSVILSSQLKGEIIKPILTLDEEHQEILMHMLKKLLDEEEEDNLQPQQLYQADNNWNQLLAKTEELENENVQLQSDFMEVKNENKDLKNQVKYLQELIDNKENEFKALMEKCLLQNYQLLQDYVEKKVYKEDELRAKILDQEHRISELELQMDEYKSKDKLMIKLKEELEVYKKESIQHHKIKNQLDQIKEKRETDKENFENLIEKKDKEINNLKQNLTNILNQLSTEKEKSLELDLKLQRKQAQIEKLQSEKGKIEQDFEEKIKEMEKLIQLLKQEQLEVNETTDPIGSNLSNEMKYSAHKQESVEIDFYKKENNKLEQKIKLLQSKLDESQLELESRQSKIQLESQMIETQQIHMLHEKLQKSQETNNKLKKQIEDLKKQTANRKPNYIDAEISILQLLQQSLEQKLRNNGK